MFGIIGWIIFGLIVGVIAKLLMPGRDPGGMIVTCLIGIAGALFGGFIGRAIGLYGPGGGRGLPDVHCRRHAPALHLSAARRQRS